MTDKADLIRGRVMVRMIQEPIKDQSKTQTEQIRQNKDPKEVIQDPTQGIDKGLIPGLNTDPIKTLVTEIITKTTQT